MGDSSPSKKRKTTRSTFMIKRRNISWPPKRLPVEIFNIIMSYLPRSSIQNMRLVDKEFEEKVSEYLFRIVVVPFKPEIYGISGAADARVNDILGAVMLQDKGMKVFEGFGRRIRKFAMSFEIDENQLANPPIKNDQEAITSFWGIYRWPYKKYNRYAQLEGLEQTADETRSMAKALRYIIAASELGLSIDGGLGWLSGPDTNQAVAARGEKPAVFGESRFIPEPKPKFGRLKSSRSSDPTSSFSQGKSTLYSSFERMLAEAGYRGENLEASIRLMLETEDGFSESTTANPFQGASQDAHYTSLVSPTSLRRTVRIPRVQEVNAAGDLHPFLETTPVNDGESEAAHNVQTAFFSYPIAAKPTVEMYYSLKPNDLTTAQKEMLLEIEWAQRAFMQSYAIAVIDNPSTFSNTTALNIARIPSRHLPILRREDFWESLPNVERLSLGVIPDWREVVKLPTSWVEDNKLQPTQAVSVVHQILHEQICRRANIKTIHFEWLCGGEYASGSFSRNQNILPAPFVFAAASMINRVQEASILKFPHLEHLSLKNCWFSPHVLGEFLAKMKTASLQSFKFDSVSLTAPVPLKARPAPVLNQTYGGGGVVAAQVLAVVQAQAPNVAQQNAVPVTNPDPSPVGSEWLNVRAGSWSHIIDAVTPGITLEGIRYNNNTLLPEPPTPLPTQLYKLEFTSCGYVHVPLDLEQGMLDPRRDSTGVQRNTELDSVMMKPMDPYLATIVNSISAMESATLQNAWNFHSNWTSQRVDLVNESRIDGCQHPGQGRFQGIIEVARQLPSSI